MIQSAKTPHNQQPMRFYADIFHTFYLATHEDLRSLIDPQVALNFPADQTLTAAQYIAGDAASRLDPLGKSARGVAKLATAVHEALIADIRVSPQFAGGPLLAEMEAWASDDPPMAAPGVVIGVIDSAGRIGAHIINAIGDPAAQASAKRAAAAMYTFLKRLASAMSLHSYYTGTKPSQKAADLAYYAHIIGAGSLLRGIIIARCVGEQ